MDKSKLSADVVKSVYAELRKKIPVVKDRLKRPMTLTEKILLGHLSDPAGAELEPGVSYLALRPDRVIMQDATAQMALLQFLSAGIPTAQTAASVHLDHLIRAEKGAREDLQKAIEENREVYDFLKSVAAKYGIGFWKPGAGIIHQVALENYAFPGQLMIGTDSHTVNAGGLAMVAIGVGGSDAVDVLVGSSWELLYPKKIGVRLSGSLSGWSSPKDVILEMAGILTAKGATNAIVEYFGPGAKTISATGKATITNMGAEIGATTSIFGYDDSIDRYLRATNRAFAADLARENVDLICADEGVYEEPDRYFDRLIEIDLSTLEPGFVGPGSPDLLTKISDIRARVEEKGYPEKISAALIGSCTNSSYEDLGRVADLARQAKTKGLKLKTPLFVSPGSETVRSTVERDKILDAISSIGGQILANACGPCIGQWNRSDVAKGEPNSIITSFNRNFPKRADGNPETLAFVGSPEIVLAYALAGTLKFNPISDSIEANGAKIKLEAPKKVDELPSAGFIFDEPIASGYIAPSDDPDSIEVAVDESSDRLQILAPFEPPRSDDEFVDMPLLLKARGKCTTDHISMAGPWLKYRGHLDNISNNMLIGAINDFSGEANSVENLLTGEKGQSAPETARAYKAAGKRWVVIGDENYGEGSSREHAAMSPRFLGAAVAITRSFARIHETNLKKQGILPLTFVDPADYEKAREGDRVTIESALSSIAPGREMKVILTSEDGSQKSFMARHTLNAEQIEWFKKGSALNKIRDDLATRA